MIWFDGWEQEPTEIGIKGKLLRFSGSNRFHANAAYVGERFSIVWFTYKAALRHGERFSIVWFTYKAALRHKHAIDEIDKFDSRGFPYIPAWRQDIVQPTATGGLFDWDALP